VGVGIHLSVRHSICHQGLCPAAPLRFVRRVRTLSSPRVSRRSPTSLALSEQSHLSVASVVGDESVLVLSLTAMRPSRPGRSLASDMLEPHAWALADVGHTIPRLAAHYQSRPTSARLWMLFGSCRSLIPEMAILCKARFLSRLFRCRLACVFCCGRIMWPHLTREPRVARPQHSTPLLSVRAWFVGAGARCLCDRWTSTLQCEMWFAVAVTFCLSVS
jgi:hypothetical protein